MDNCPKCAFSLSDGAVECPACGVVVQKYRAQAARAPRPPAAVPAAPPATPSPAGTPQPAHGPLEVGGLLIFFILFQLAAMVYTLLEVKEVLSPLILLGNKVQAFFPGLLSTAELVFLLNAFPVIGNHLGIILILARVPRTPLYWRVLLVLTFLANIVGFFALRLTTEHADLPINPVVSAGLKSLVHEAQARDSVAMFCALLWIWYWEVSERVKSTFMAPYGPSHVRRLAMLSGFSCVLSLSIFALILRLGLKTPAYFLVLVFLLTGAIVAIFALAGVRKHGRKGILFPALTGLILNEIFVCAWIAFYMAS